MVSDMRLFFQADVDATRPDDVDASRRFAAADCSDCGRFCLFILAPGADRGVIAESVDCCVDADWTLAAAAAAAASSVCRL